MSKMYMCAGCLVGKDGNSELPPIERESCTPGQCEHSVPHTWMKEGEGYLQFCWSGKPAREAEQCECMEVADE